MAAEFPLEDFESFFRLAIVDPPSRILSRSMNLVSSSNHKPTLCPGHKEREDFILTLGVFMLSSRSLSIFNILSNSGVSPNIMVFICW